MLICLQAPVSLSSYFCTSFSAAPLGIASLTLLLKNDDLDKLLSLPRSTVFPTLLDSSVGTTLCLPSDLKLSYPPECRLPHSLVFLNALPLALTKKGAVPAAILFRSISMAAAKTSTSGAPTNVAFPPSPIHLLTAFKNDWSSHKYGWWVCVCLYTCVHTHKLLGYLM